METRREIDEDDIPEPPKPPPEAAEVPPDWRQSQATFDEIAGTSAQAQEPALEQTLEKTDATQSDSTQPPQDAQDLSKTQDSGKLALPDEVTREMNGLWQKSVQDIDKGTVREHGATLVEEKEGRIQLTNIIAGNEDSVKLNREVADGEKVIGTFHTHPYAPDEGGYTDMAFSGRDIALTINAGDRLAVVQSGDTVFALERTDATPEHLDANVLKQEFKDALTQFAEQDGMSFPEAMYAVNLALCQEYGLAFHAGSHGNLKEVYRP